MCPGHVQHIKPGAGGGLTHRWGSGPQVLWTSSPPHRMPRAESRIHRREGTAEPPPTWGHAQRRLASIPGKLTTASELNWMLSIWMILRGYNFPRECEDKKEMLRSSRWETCTGMCAGVSLCMHTFAVPTKLYISTLYLTVAERKETGWQISSTAQRV